MDATTARRHPGLISPPPAAYLTVLFPLAYLVFTTIRGPLASHWYPYPFADIHHLGYARVAVNAVWIMLLFFAISAGATALDRRIRQPGGAAS